MSDQTNTFADPVIAQKARDALTRLMIKVMDQERPPYQYGTVQTIDPGNRKCTVILNGDTTAITVAFGGVRPTAVGQVVRVSGKRGDRFISDVMGGAVTSDPITTSFGAPTNFLMGGDYRGVFARCDAVLGAYQYEFQFADNVGMSVNARSYKTQSPQISEGPLNAGQIVYGRVRALTTYGGAGSWSSILNATAVAMPVESVTDGAAPSSSPTAVVTGALGWLLVEWLAVANNDPVTYEVHISTTNGFTPSGATKISETSGTFTSIRDLPSGGGILQYGTTYFVRLIAKDKDGAAAAGGQGSGTITKVGTIDVSQIDYNKLGDGAPPSSSPTPSITNGIGFLYVSWTALTDDDYTVYDVHISTVTGFTPSSATKVGGTPSNFMFVKNVGSGAGGGPLVYGTTYFVKIIAKDVDGQAAASAQASGTPLQTQAADLSDGSVTTTKVGFTIAGANEAQNTSFEVDSNSDGLADFWDIYNNTSGTEPVTTTLPAGLYGLKAQRIAWAVTNTSTKGICSLGRPSLWLPNTTYMLSFYARGTLSVQQIMGLYWNTAPTTVTAVANPVLSTTAWQRYIFRINWGSSVEILGRFFISILSGAGVTGFVEFDGVQIEQGDVVTAWSPPPDEILPGTVGTTQISDNAITSAKITAGAVVAGKIAANAISANEIQANAITAVKLAAGSINTEKLTVGALGNNLIMNGSFEETSSSDPNMPAGFISRFFSGTASYGLSATAIDGAQSLSMSCNTGAPNSASISARAVPCNPGDIYAFEVWYRPSVTLTGGLYFRVDFDTTETFVVGASLVSIGENQPGTGGVWQLIQGQVVVPAGKTWMRGYVAIANPSSTVTVLYDAMKLRKTINSTTIEAGAITTSKIAANAITANEIAANTITAAKMVAGTITAASGIIANLAVDTAQIANAAITTAKIAGANITTALIGTAQITNALIANLAVDNGKIANLAVDNAKINDVAADKITTATITAQTITLGSGGTLKVGTAPTGAGMLVNDQGISIYNSSGTRLIYLDATTGAGSITSGAISGGTIDGSTITGGVLRTQSSGLRIEISSTGTFANVMGLYTGGSTEVNPGYIGTQVSGSGTTQTLAVVVQSPTNSGASQASVSVQNGSTGGAQRALVNISSDHGVRLVAAADDMTFQVASSKKFLFKGAGYLAGDQNGSAGRVGAEAGEVIHFKRNTGTGATEIYQNGVLSKTFVIDHPQDDRRFLVHAVIEGPENAVFYRGRDRMLNGTCFVSLPRYFEELTQLLDRTVQITPIAAERGRVPALAASEVVNGTFTVYGEEDCACEFYWEVKAVRSDVPTLHTQPLKTDVVVHGDGPYRYLTRI